MQRYAIFSQQSKSELSLMKSKFRKVIWLLGVGKSNRFFFPKRNLYFYEIRQNIRQESGSLSSAHQVLLLLRMAIGNVSVSKHSTDRRVFQPLWDLPSDWLLFNSNCLLFSDSADSATETFFLFELSNDAICMESKRRIIHALWEEFSKSKVEWVGSSPFRWTFSACLDWSDSRDISIVLLPKMRYDERTNQPAKITQKSIRRTNLRGRGEEWEGRTCRRRDDAVRRTKNEKNTQMRINGATNRSNRELRRKRSRNDGRQKLGSRSTYANRAMREQEPTLNLIRRKIVTFIAELFNIKEGIEDLVEGTMMCLTPSIFWYLKNCKILKDKFSGYTQLTNYCICKEVRKDGGEFSTQ